MREEIVPTSRSRAVSDVPRVTGPLAVKRRTLCRVKQTVNSAVAAVIRCTADAAKADKRTRSKWSRVMRYAAAYKPDSEPLGQFAIRKGCINACAARFGRCLGRGRATRPGRRGDEGDQQDARKIAPPPFPGSACSRLVPKHGR